MLAVSTTNDQGEFQIECEMDSSFRLMITLPGNYVDEYTNVNQPFPFPDALQEFSVQTSNYSAEYGENAGGVVNVVTKSGTNSFHGDAFEFVRNPIFNAQNYFATPTTPDQIKRNQYGGTFGGPIIHDKTFFFVGYQRTAFRNLMLEVRKWWDRPTLLTSWRRDLWNSRNYRSGCGHDDRRDSRL